MLVRVAIGQLIGKPNVSKFRSTLNPGRIGPEAGQLYRQSEQFGFVPIGDDAHVEPPDRLGSNIDQPDLTASSRARPDERETPCMTRKLLIVDDQIGLTRVIQRMAEGLGYETRIANCPMEAVDAFVDFRPDVVILDMIMPGKDGIDVLNEMLLTGEKTRIVLTSGLSDGYLRLAAGVARFHELEGVHVLRKPFRRAELADLLR